MIYVCAQSLSPDNSLQLHDCSPPGSSVHGIFQAGILEWVAISSSRGSSLPDPGINHPPTQPPPPAFQVDSLLLIHLGTQDELICKAEIEIQA